MNRKQRRKKLQKRQAHRDQFEGQIKVMRYGEDEVTLPRGRRPRPGFRRHKESTTPNLRSFLNELGIKLSASQMDLFNEMAIKHGEQAVINKIRDERTKASIAPNSAPHPPGVHADEVELVETGIAPTALEMLPAGEGQFLSIENWDELCAEARRRKRGIQRHAEKEGLVLIDNGDPKNRTDWRRA